MTAVASPPSLQPLPRIGWNSGGSGQGGLNSISTDEVSRMFMPRKSAQRSNSSSTITSSSSGTPTITATSSQVNGGPSLANGELGGWASRKKPAKGLWPSSKAEPVSGITPARPQLITSPSLGTTQAAMMSSVHQPSPILPSQNNAQPQQSGGRGVSGQLQGESPAVLRLLPMNSTFERKQINVPFFPEVLRIGRQTNQKTVPTPTNGYFDSKVLSRQHAEVWADRNGKIWIRDIKSSNGTFVNGQRLSPENRDSDPHELREHDMLELGIDIVSEDQKKIVHHKVSAKVEHAGIYGNGTNVLDLSFGDIDPAAGGGLMPSPMGLQMVQVRGRVGSQGSTGSNGTRGTVPSNISSNNLNAMGQQRHMNFWLSPLTIEQVVKKLTVSAARAIREELTANSSFQSEIKQAKQQSHELNQTGDFFGTLLNSEPGKETGKLPQHEQGRPHQANGIQLPLKIDPIPRFSDPPAPPPQQPLPEKPDSARASPLEAIAQLSLPRAVTEKPTLGVHGSPTKAQTSNQVLSLVEALSSAKKELDSQGARMKAVEDMLQQERSARESAEERARLLENQRRRGENGSMVEEAFEPPAEAAHKQSDGIHQKDGNHHSQQTRSWQATKTPGELSKDTANATASTARLQQRVELMVAEMDEMKKQMEQYKQRAESAEEESVTTRKTLAEMIEKIRRDGASKDVDGIKRRVSMEIATQTETGLESDKDTFRASTLLKKAAGGENGHAIGPGELAQLERAMATALARSPNATNRLSQSAPFASMLGVVLLGVGLMTYLNGWQKVER